MIGLLARQHRALNIVFVLVFIFGGLSLTKLGREELPEFGGEGLDIHAVLPGATPDEMDMQVARLLNKALVGLPGIEDVSSSAGEGFVSLSVDVKRDDPDLDGLRREIAQLISQVPDLPTDLEGPYINRQFDRLFPPITLLFKGGNAVERHNAWLKVEQTLLNLPEVDEVQVLGDRDRRIEVRVDPLALVNSGLRLDSLSEGIRHSMTDAGAGQLHSKLDNSRIRTAQQPIDPGSLASIMMTSNYGALPISYFADVVETLGTEKTRIEHEGKQAWYVNLFRRNGTNVSELSTGVQRIVAEFNTSYKQQGDPFRISIIQDRSRVVTESLRDLTQSIILGMLIVFAVLWIFLGSRNAFFAAIGIPFSFFAAFIAMDLLGLSINILTLFGLVLVCGMVVDDAIVVLENIDRKAEKGDLSLDAIISGLREVAPAVVAATGTTVAVFMPLMLMSGGMGLYISQIPQVAILALVASLVECFIVLPIHMLGSGTRREKLENDWRLKIREVMDRLATNAASLSHGLVTHAWTALLGFAGLIALTTWVAWLSMDFKLFEATEIRTIRFAIEFDKDIDLDSNHQLIKHAISQFGELNDHFRDVVQLSGYRNLNYRTKVREHISSIELPLSEQAIADNRAAEIADEVEFRLLALPGVRRVQRSLETNSPPTDVPVQINLYSEDADSLRKTAAKVRVALTSIPSIQHVSDPMEDGVPERVFELDSKRLAQYKLNSDQVAHLLRTSITGSRIGKIDRGSEVVDVYVTTHDKREALGVITLLDGTHVPLEALGRFTDQSSPESIDRFQGNRYIAITAEVDEKVLSVFKTHREIEKLIDDSILLSGVTFEQRGEYSDTRQSVASMLQAGLIGLGLAYFILTLLFKSFLQPLVVLLAIPLAYMGVVWGMTLTGQTLDLMGFVGIVGLVGIVINDALVWVNFYNRSREAGIKATDAAILAVKQRFRPIWLTTITTVGGLLPVSLSASAGIANAMANTIVYGLVTASFLLLLFLPVCVVILDDLANRFGRLNQRLQVRPTQLATGSR